MNATARRKTSLSLDAALLDDARTLGLNVSALAEEALRASVAEARHRQWLADNAETFTAQSDWHDRNGHPLSDIIAGPAATTWNR